MKISQITSEGVKTIEVTPEEYERRMQEGAGDLTVPPHLRGRNGTSPANAPIAEGDLSPARRWLLGLQRNGKPRIEAIEVEGKEWFIKRLDFAGLTRLTLLTPRDRNGALDMFNADNLAALTTAMLEGCIVSGSDDDTPFFTWAEAYESARDTSLDVVKTVGELFTAIIKINPDILPGRGAQNEDDAPMLPDEEAEEREKKDSSGSQENEPSGTPLTTSPSNGSSSTENSDTPAISPGASMEEAASPATGAATGT